jgi:hypothetical protein
MRRRYGFALSVLLAACALPAGDARGQTDGAEPLPDAATLRRQLEIREQQRRDAEAARPFRWEENHRPFELGRETPLERSSAIVELHYAASEIPCFVAFHRKDDPDTDPVHAPMGLRGSQWIRLAPGAWDVRLVAGYATGPVLAYPPSTLEMKGGKVYRLTFGEDQERGVRNRAREEALEPERRNVGPRVRVSPNL